MDVMKQLRQQQIRELIAQRPIRTQQELAAALRERGVRATQATVSRDVAELGLTKARRDGIEAYALPVPLAEPDVSGEERLRRLLTELPIEIHEAGQLLVVRALPGSARDRGGPRSRPLAGGRGFDRRRRHAVHRLYGSPVRSPGETSAAGPRVARGRSSQMLLRRSLEKPAGAQVARE